MGERGKGHKAGKAGKWTFAGFVSGSGSRRQEPAASGRARTPADSCGSLWAVMAGSGKGSGRSRGRAPSRENREPRGRRFTPAGEAGFEAAYDDERAYVQGRPEDRAFDDRRG